MPSLQALAEDQLIQVKLAEMYIRLESARASSFVMDEAAQIHGSCAYMSETEINRLFRTERFVESAIPSVSRVGD